MVSQLRCSTIGSKTPVCSDVAPQRADSTHFALAFKPLRECTELRSVPTAILPRMTRLWVPHYSPFSFAVIFYENRWFDINLCQIDIEFRWCETLSRLVQTSCTFALSPCVYGFAYNTLRACWPHSETLFLQFFVPKNAILKPIFQTKTAFKLN